MAQSTSASRTICALGLNSTGSDSVLEFVRKYAVYHLVHVEAYENAEDAIRREKQLKKWNRD